MKRTPVLLTVLVIVVAACAGDDGSATTTPSGDSETTGDVLLMVTSEGGFVPAEFNLERMPRHVLTEDGTLYYQGPVPAIFPGPLLPNVQVTSVDAATLDEIMLLVEELGLPEIDERIDDSAADMVADATTEVITYFDENGSHRLGIYALGLTEVGSSTDRILAAELIEVLDAAAAENPSRAYQPERLQVAAGPAIQFDEPARTVEPWPLDVAFTDMPEWALDWRCIEIIEATEVAELFAIFSDANQATLWDTGEEEVSMKARPLLPGELACGAAPQG
jgi:hypothetical protein